MRANRRPHYPTVPRKANAIIILGVVDSCGSTTPYHHLPPPARSPRRELPPAPARISPPLGSLLPRLLRGSAGAPGIPIRRPFLSSGRAPVASACSPPDAASLGLRAAWSGLGGRREAASCFTRCALVWRASASSRFRVTYSPKAERPAAAAATCRPSCRPSWLLSSSLSSSARSRATSSTASASSALSASSSRSSSVPRAWSGFGFGFGLGLGLGFGLGLRLGFELGAAGPACVGAAAFRLHLPL